MTKKEELGSSLLRKFEIEGVVGHGAYGIVWKARDKNTGKIVALKKIFRAFQNETDAQRTFREVMFLQQLHHVNIVKLLNVLKAENEEDIYLVFEYLDTDLNRVIQSGVLEDLQIRYIMYQIFSAVLYMHSGGVIHRDLKPGNILLNAECQVKICDVGLMRSVPATLFQETSSGTSAVRKETGEDNDSCESKSSLSGGVQNDTIGTQILTDYVATRWYRAPEILLGSPTYNFNVDMWSCGCVLAEMLTGFPILKGTSTMDQLDKIVSLLGIPDDEDIKSIHSPFAETMLHSLSPAHRVSLRNLIPNAPAEAISLLSHLLVFNPEKRWSAAQCLSHDYIKGFFTGNELVRMSLVRSPDLLVGPDCDASGYREILFKEIMKKKKEHRERKRHKSVNGGKD